MMNKIAFLSATEMAERIRDKEFSPVDVTSAILERIEEINPALNAFCTMMSDEALETARQAERAIAEGKPCGPLHGVPIAVKDNVWVKGVRTTFGSKLLENDVPSEDAPLITRLREAGAIIVGRTNTPEFGWKGVTDNLVFGITRNPWNVELTPGGSSGGSSAAVAAGLVPIGIGTDGGGSLRIPASFCGIVGLKPSYGRVPHYPGVSLGMLRHMGGMTRTVADTALLLDVISGSDDRDQSSSPDDGAEFSRDLDSGIAGLRVAYSADLGYAQVEPQVAEICAKAARRFAEADAVVEAVELNWRDPYVCWNTFFYGSAGARLIPELEAHGDQLDPGLRQAVEASRKLSAQDMAVAYAERDAFYQTVRQFFQNYDLLITPSLAVPPFPVGQDNADPLPGQEPRELHWTQFTYPFNLTGHPAISIPAGWNSDELPIGLQIVGHRFADATVLRAARAFEQIQPWAHKRPA